VPLLFTTTVTSGAPLPQASLWQEAPESGRSDTINDESLRVILSEVIEERNITGMVALVMVDHKIVARAAAGLRNASQPDFPMTIDDKIHLGSCTKAITALLAGRLVDSGQLSWDDTIGKRLPAIADAISPAYRDVTLTQLLQHRGGVMANGAAWNKGGVASVENRLEIIRMGLEKLSEETEIGKFHYSNLGYLVVAAMIESAGGKSWEQLVEERVFEPLGIKSAGFGPPIGDGPFDQPWGHRLNNGKIIPIRFDNPPATVPAGGVHMNLADWARLIAVQMPTSTSEKPFLSSQTLEFLHTPPATSTEHAGETPYCGGWMIVDYGKDFCELQHEGSNTMWLATAIVRPRIGTAILVVTNYPLDLSLPANAEVVERIRQALSLRR
jgi:CubicO group peptidase (beta-lactamase class C family)